MGVRKRPVPPPVKPVPSLFAGTDLVSPFIIRGLAERKGLTVDSVSRGKGGTRFVRFKDGKGTLIDKGRLNGFTLYEARTYLAGLPDRS